MIKSLKYLTHGTTTIVCIGLTITLLSTAIVNAADTLNPEDNLAKPEIELKIRAMQKKFMQDGMQKMRMQETIQKIMQEKVKENIDSKPSSDRIKPDQLQQQYQSTMKPKLQGMMLEKVSDPASQLPISEQQLREKRRIQKKKHIYSSLPKSVLDKQHTIQVIMPEIPDATILALQAGREAAEPLIDREFHKNGQLIIVPEQYKTIQAGINAATSGDTVLVRAGTYYEQLVMKDGVKLVSDSVKHGDELVAVKGAILRMPRRTLRTIIDGSHSKPSKHGMFDFNPGVGRKTIIDGFTIQNMPHQNHHIPGHAHGINVRGASPVITNCLIDNMGSTGIGNHVVYKDQGQPLPARDFRWANIKDFSSAVIYHNIVKGSLGLGIGCNHFSNPTILANEVYGNDDSSINGTPSPGIGGKHGSAAVIIGNIVHDNPGGGIQCKVGDPQGSYSIDRPTHTSIIKNVVYNNGTETSGISSQGAGSKDTPVTIKGNYVYNSGSAGIGLRSGAVAIIEDNMVSGSKDPGIAIKASTVIKLNGNSITDLKDTPGILLVKKSTAYEMLGNTVTPGDYPPFMLKDGSVVMDGDKVAH